MKITKKVFVGVSALLYLSLISCATTNQAQDVNEKENVEASLESENVLTESTTAPADDNTIITARNIEGDVKTVESVDSEEGAGAQEAGENESESVTEESVDAGEVSEVSDEGESDKKNGKKNYTGWIDASGRDIEHKLGILRLRAKPRLGTFNFSVLAENGKFIPTLSSANEYTSTSFYLKADKKIYKLLADSNIKTMAKKRDNGIELLYRIQNLADVDILMEVLPTTEDSELNMIKITGTVLNTGTKKIDFALKAVFDTVLGESTQYHFYSSQDIPVKSEAMYRGPVEENWIISKNDKAKMQFLLNGADITSPEVVALANFATLDVKTWEPDMLSYRAFDTVLSYNNSAIGIQWAGEKLSPDKTFNVITYIAFAQESEKLTGDVYIENFNREEESEEIIENEIDTEESSEISVPKKLKKDDTPKPTPIVKFDITKLNKDHLSPEYIQKLLDRIAALEDDDSSMNKEELLQLNAELDAILEILRQ